MDSFRLFFTQQLWRHLRHPAIWIVIILTMIGARFFIPLPTEGYVTLSVNNAYPVMSSGVIGLQLGIITALLLSPLVYIYLKAGPTRIQPWQIEDVTPSRRLAMNLGQGFGDVIALFFVLFWIGIAGLVLCFFRLPVSEINPLHFFLTLFLVAGPAMVMVAGIKRVFSARPWLKGAWGDVLFFIFWMAGNVIAATLFDKAPIKLGQDIFGFAASIAVSTEEPVTAMVVGGTPSVEQYITLDPVSGFARLDFLLARFQWFAVGVGLFALAAFIHAPRRSKVSRKAGLRQQAFAGLDLIGDKVSVFLIAPFRAWPVLESNMRQLLKPGWLILILIGLSLSGLFLPFRKVTGPGIFLILIFMTSRLGAAWEERHLRQLRATLPMATSVQALYSGLTVFSLCVLMYLPALISKGLQGNFQTISMDVLMIAIIVPIIGIGLGMLTRSTTFARLLLLGMWYAYLNL